MTNKERNQVFEEAQKRRMKTMGDKGREYSKGDIDVNYNFHEVARRLGIPSHIVCLVYFMKAILSVEKWAKDGDRGLSSGETIYSRLDDIKNYADILESLLKE